MCYSRRSTAIIPFSGLARVLIVVCIAGLASACSPAEAERPNGPQGRDAPQAAEPAHSHAPTGNAAIDRAPHAAAESDSFAVQLIDHDDSDAFRLLIGPVDIPEAIAGGGHHHHGVLPEPRTVTFPKSVHLTGFNYRIYDGSGEELPSDVLHHMNVIKPHYRELFLPISQRMLALGKETGAQSLPGFLFGHPIDEGTEVIVTAMLHNPVGPRLEDVTVEIEIDYVEATRPWPLWEVHPFQLDVQFPVGEKAFDLPPGRSEFAYEGSPTLEGRIAALGSHLHDYAESIRLEDVTDDELIWEGFPIKDEDGTVKGVTIGRLYKEFGKKVYPDHVYRVTVHYDNPTTDTLKQGGMGVVAGAFIPSDTDSWPRADTTHSLYALDRLHYLRQVSGTYEELLAQLSADSLQTVVPRTGGHEHHNH